MPPAAHAAPTASSADVLNLYEFFLLKLEDETRAGAVKPDLLQDRLGLCRTQLQGWLKRAVEEGRAKKLKNPVRYRYIRC